MPCLASVLKLSSYLLKCNACNVLFYFICCTLECHGFVCALVVVVVVVVVVVCVTFE